MLNHTAFANQTYICQRGDALYCKLYDKLKPDTTGSSHRGRPASDFSTFPFISNIIYIPSLGVKVQSRPVAAYRAGTAMAVPHLWETLTRECAKVGVVVITMQYGRTTSKLLATVLQSDAQR